RLEGPSISLARSAVFVTAGLDRGAGILVPTVCVGTKCRATLQKSKGTRPVVYRPPAAKSAFPTTLELSAPRRAGPPCRIDPACPYTRLATEITEARNCAAGHQGTGGGGLHL